MDYTAEISVVIVSYNVYELLDKCLASIENNIHSLVKEIIVIDNSSSDGTVEKIKSKHPSVKILSNNYNAGFSTANNQGVAASSGKYIFLLNPDTEIIDDVFVPLMKFSFIDK